MQKIKKTRIFLTIFIFSTLFIGSGCLYKQGAAVGVDKYRDQTVGANYQLPKALVALYAFEEQYGAELYSQSFCLDTQEDDYSYLINFKSLKQEIEYRKHIKKFAHVDGTGGFVAFWIRDENRDLENAPIINYGSEGSIRIVAKNINEFLRILSFDVELMDGSSYKMKSDYEESPYKSEYIAWLRDELSLEPVKDLSEQERYGESEDVLQIRSEAEKMYKEEFIQWHSQFSDIESRFED